MNVFSHPHALGTSLVLSSLVDRAMYLDVYSLES